METRSASQIQIDTRPLGLILLSKSSRYFIFILLGLITYYFFQKEPPTGLSVSGYRSIILFAGCVFLWVFQLLPMPITGLLAIAAPPLFGVASTKETFAFFGNETVFFILGVFILAAAMMKSGLSTRVALRLLRGSGKSPKKLLFRIMVTATLLSFVISEHAVAAIMFPIALEISRALEFEPEGGSYGRLLFMSMAWGCIVGGIATLLGSGRAPLSVGILSQMTGEKITFTQWTLATLPVVLLMFAAAYLMITRYFRIDVESVEPANQILLQKMKQQGKPSATEWFISIIFLITILLWMKFGLQIGMAVISIMAVVALFVFRVVSWKDLESYVNWGVFLMYGGAIAISSVMDKTGGGKWLAELVVNSVGGSPLTVVVLFTFGALALTEAISNSAVVAIMTPVAISVSSSLGIDPKGLTLLIALASGLGNALPMSTPAMAIAFSAGYFKLKDTLVPALMMSIASVLALLLAGQYWWPFLGIHVIK
ncbi:MAG: DASS family sodium-coupled anion symporter [Deltaproteobacteria bacterium]|nr:DASS family sodium-coupled anion symporter [Deltaproteobacteria bacterium]